MMAEIKPVSPLELEGNVSENWKKFAEEFTGFLEATGLTSEPEKTKLALFINLVGKEAFKLYKTFEFSGNSITLKTVLDIFESYCESYKNNVVYHSYKFNIRKQETGESFDDYLSSVKELASFCKFDDIEHRMIRDKIISGMRNNELRQNLFALGVTDLDKIIDYCRLNEKSHESSIAVNESESKSSVTKDKVKDSHSVDSDRKETDISDLENSSCEPVISNIYSLSLSKTNVRGTNEKYGNYNFDYHVPMSLCFVDVHKGINLEYIKSCQHCSKSKILQKGNANETEKESKEIKREQYLLDDTIDIYNNLPKLEENVKILQSEEKAYQYFYCEECGKRFLHRFAKKKHQLLVHAKINSTDESNDFKMKINPKNLDNRRRFIHTVNFFECVHCGKRMSSKQNLVYHQMLHTGEKPYECDVCHKKFRNKTTLKMHQWTHTGEKKFECNLCGKRFIQKYSLKLHEMSHFKS